MAKNSTEPTDFVAAKQAKDAIEELFADITVAEDPEWEEVVVPAWKNRKFFVRGANVGERTVLLNKGWRQVEDKNTGLASLEQTPLYIPLIVATCLYWDNPASGARERVFNTRNPKHMDMLNRQKNDVLDPIVKIANRLSGLAKEQEKQIEQDFLEEPETTGYGSD